jgi:hypothetical protein
VLLGWTTLLERKIQAAWSECRLDMGSTFKHFMDMGLVELLTVGGRRLTEAGQSLG